MCTRTRARTRTLTFTFVNCAGETLGELKTFTREFPPDLKACETSKVWKRIGRALVQSGITHERASSCTHRVSAAPLKSSPAAPTKVTPMF